MKKKIFFVGIGGKGLNGIAKICLEKNWQVSGVDTVIKKETTDLEKNGAKIFYTHSPKNISENLDIVVYTSIAKDCPEVITAKKLGILTMKRSEFLKILTQNNFRICISGSHGKSTTTAILGLSAISSNIDATIFGGAYAKEFDGYNHFGKSKYAIIEACEYDRSFYDLIGNLTVITSIEKSHLEYYKNENDMLNAFKTFVRNHSENSVIVANGDNLKIREVLTHAKCKIILFGFGKHNDYVISKIIKRKKYSIFSVKKEGQILISNMKINIPGNYNVLNFVACISAFHNLGFSLSGISETAKTFTGVGRRFEIHKNKIGQILIDDFAHHPTQVKNLFDGIRQFYPTEKVCAVFQPRQYNLMKNFIKEYGEAFKKADEVIITNILPALGDTEQDLKSIDTNILAKTIETRSNKPVKIINDFSDIENYIKKKYKQKSIITTIGAGDIYKVKELLMK